MSDIKEIFTTAGRFFGWVAYSATITMGIMALLVMPEYGTAAPPRPLSV